jgi:hypothetical protein
MRLHTLWPVSYDANAPGLLNTTPTWEVVLFVLPVVGLSDGRQRLCVAWYQSAGKHCAEAGTYRHSCMLFLLHGARVALHRPAEIKHAPSNGMMLSSTH